MSATSSWRTATHSLFLEGRPVLNSGHGVRVIEDFSTGSMDNLAAVSKSEGLSLVRGDVCDQEKAMEALDGIEIVYHLAALTSVVKSVSPIT